MNTNPESVLHRKFIELVGIDLNAACTNLNPVGDAQKKFEFLASRRYPGFESSKNKGRVFPRHASELATAGK